jgi:flagellar hook assembly protein FlgD
VRVTAHDVRGDVLATLLDATQAAGPHAFTWDARDAHGNVLPSGVYVLCVEQGATSCTQRVTLVR